MKKLLSFTTLLVATITLVACSSSTKNTSSQREKELTLTLNGSGEYSAKASKVATKPNVSVYRDNLNSIEQSVYDTILSGLLEYKDTFRLQEPFTKDKMKRVVAIVLLDNPELYYVAPKFNYELNEEGNVVAISFEFTLPKDMVDEKNKRLLALASSQLDISQNPASGIVRTLQNIEADHITLEGGSPFYELHDVFSARTNLYTYNQLLSYIFRRKEVQTSIVFGENINQSYSNIGFEKGSVVDTGTSFEFHFQKTYSWLIVNIKGSYYHIDAFMNAHYRKKMQENMGYGITYLSPYLGMTDRFAANSRLMSLNEEVLGVFPTAEDTSYSYVHSSDNAVLVNNEADFVAAISRKLESGEYGSSITHSVISFVPDPDSFTRISQGLDVAMNKLTKNKEKVKSYKVFYDPYSQTIHLYDVVFDKVATSNTE